MGRVFRKVFRILGLGERKGILHGFLPFSPVSLTELCSFWYSLKDLFTRGRGGGGGSYFPYILLNEIQTMFSQLAKRSAIGPDRLCSATFEQLLNFFQF